MELIQLFFADSLREVLYFSYNTAFIWAPIVLGIWFIYVWIYYVRALFLSGQEYVLLEIKIPKDTYKSPLAMEVALGGIHQTMGESTWYDKYISGKMRPYFSLEIVSIEGRIRFFIRTRPFFKNMAEAQIYAQYPGVEIYEVHDYTEYMPYGQKKSDWGIWGCEYMLTKDDPYPIKTYVDYGLLNDPKEELKIDPLTSILEFLGSIGKGEQVWIQILVRATKNTNKKPGGIFGKPRDWKKEGEELVEKLRKEYGKQEGGKDKIVFDRPMTKGQQETIASIERSISKQGFDCGIRAIYFGDGEHFSPSSIPAILGLFRPFSSNELNGFRPMNTTGFNYPWEDMLSLKGLKTRSKNIFLPRKSIWKGAALQEKKQILFDAYIRRSYFNPPYKRKWFVLNSEELATIFHFPGRVAETPTFERIESKKVEPPAGLPI